MRDDDDTFTALDTRDGRRVTLRAKRGPTREEMAKAHTPADWLELFPNPRERVRPGSYNKFLRIFMGKADDCRDEDDDDRDEIDREDEGNGDRGDDGGGDTDHALSRLADLTVESGKFSSRAEALNWLISHPNGHAFTRLHKAAAAAKESPMSSIESLQNIVKAHGVAGVVEIAKNITDAEKSYSITEEEFVKLIDTAARAAHPELGARAFEKVYEHNPVLAKAIAVIKAGLAEQLLSGGMPVQVVGGEDAQDVDNPQAALEALHELGRKLYPQLTEAQAFAKVFEDPKHAALAAKAHRRPAPTTSFPFPR
jgi:hypothetical protein